MALDLMTTEKTDAPSPPLWIVLYSIILLEGYVSISAEILTLRQLIAFVGSSIIVTSTIIGIFLLFLAGGYQHGSKIKQRHAWILRRNFSITAIWLGIGLSYPFVYLFFFLLQSQLHTASLLTLVAYLLIITAPLIYLLGYTLPITMNLFKQNRPAGYIGGKALSISTIGSFLGAVFTSLVLLHYLGVAWTIVIAATILLILALLLCQKRLSLLLQATLTLVALYFIYSFNVTYENHFFQLTDNYANYRIIHPVATNIKLLSVNNSTSSMLTPSLTGYPYIETIRRILFSADNLNLRDKNILVVGAGGFTLTARGDHGNTVTYVDIDKKIKQVVTKHFLNPIHGDFIAQDARAFFATHNQKYDAIVSDAYSNRFTIPAYLLTIQYFQAVKRHLTPHGTAIFNIIAHPTLAEPYSKHIDNTLRRIFPNCMAIPIHYTQQATNILYVCHHASNAHDQTIYSDNLNRSDRDHFSSIKR